MKKVMIALLMTFICFAASAQFVHTRWKGSIKGDAAQACTIKFGKDTVVLYGNDGGVIETMKYTANPKSLILTLTKIAGQSDCNTTGAGKYKWAVAGNSLSLAVTEDNCGDRSAALDKTVWTKQKSK